MFSTNPSDYLPVVYSRWQGIEFMNYSPFIYAFGQEDVAITGSGTFDGQADATHWWDWKTPADAEFASLEAQANAGVPPEQRVFGDGWHFRRGDGGTVTIWAGDGGPELVLEPSS